MGALEAELPQPPLDLLDSHEELPQQPAAVVLDHRHDGALADREVSIRIPRALLAEAIDEAGAYAREASFPELLVALVASDAFRYREPVGAQKAGAP